MRMAESVLARLFSALVSISWRIFCISRCLILSSMKLLTSSLHFAGFCFIFSLSLRGMRIVIVADMSVLTVIQIVIQLYKHCCHTLSSPKNRLHKTRKTPRRGLIQNNVRGAGGGIRTPTTVAIPPATPLFS